MNRKTTWVVAGVIALQLLVSGCGTHLTVAPPPVKNRAVAFDQGVQNAAIVGYDSTGLIVTKGWLAKYDALLKEHGPRLPADNRVLAGNRDGITPSGANYHVNFEVNDRFADLKFYERNRAP